MLQLKKFSDIAVSTREEARESRPHPEEPRVRLLAREEGSFPCVFGIEFPAFPSHLKRRPSPQERREQLQGRATIPRGPRFISPFQGNLFSLECLDFQAEDRLTPWWHVGEPCGKASWESLEGPQWKRASSRLQGRTSWMFSSCGRCSRLTTGPSGPRSGGLRKGQFPCELLGGLSGFLSRRCRGLRPCVESVQEPEDSSPC